KKTINLFDLAYFDCPSKEEKSQGSSKEEKSQGPSKEEKSLGPSKEEKCESIDVWAVKNTYSAKLYRILMTDKPIENISIYTSYGYTYGCDKKNLEAVRNMSLNK